MATTVPTQIRIDRDIKEKAVSLFANLGLDMSGAINMFLHQCVLRITASRHWRRWQKPGVCLATQKFQVMIIWMT